MKDTDQPDEAEAPPPTASRALALTEPPAARLLPGIIDAETESADRYARAARADNTHRAYAADWTIFSAWCVDRGEPPLPAPAEMVRRFVAWEAERGRSPATIERRVAAIGYFQRATGFVPPTAQPDAGRPRETMAGIRRAWTTPRRRKSAADALVLHTMLAAVPGEGLRPLRDRAVLAIGMAAALRRSEVVVLRVDDIAVVPEGLRITIVRSKTDQARAGAIIAVPEGSRLRPKARLLEWIAEAGHDEGPLFRRLTQLDPLTR